MKVTDLPSELRLVVLSHLDLPSLARAVQSHSAFHSVWESYPEHLSRAICIRTGLAGFKTAGAAAPLEPESWRTPGRGRGGGGLDDTPDEQELKRVIEGQRSMTGAFDGVRDWKSYTKARWRIDKNWKYGRCEQKLLELDLEAARDEGLEGDEAFWRFKLDPVSGWILVTGVFGGVWAFDKGGQLKWFSLVPRTPYPHVELTYHGSTSYFCTSLGDTTLVVWSYHDPANPGAPRRDVHDPRGIVARLDFHHTSLDPEGRGYRPLASIEIAAGFTASKMRYPHVLFATADTPTVHRWNFVDRAADGARLETDTSRMLHDHGNADGSDFSDRQVSYLELDDDSFFMSGFKSVNVYRWDVGHRRWPPRAPPGYRYLQPLLPFPLYIDGDPNRIRPWLAVHHDSRSRFLVGASCLTTAVASVLSITYRYKEAIFSDDREEIEQRTINLRLDGVLGITQLSVENDRAIFVATSDSGQALFVVPLRPFESLAEFAADPLKPICLAYPLPCLQNPSRLESTSTDVYLPICVPLVSLDPLDDSGGSHQKFWDFREAWAAVRARHTFPFPMRWQTLDAQTLVDYGPECVPLDGGDRRVLVDCAREVKYWAGLEGLLELTGVSGLMRFSFAE
ncbi:hypothetical protein JCM11491_004870 [Sporobolomyces phaffii]